MVDSHGMTVKDQRILSPCLVYIEQRQIVLTAQGTKQPVTLAKFSVIVGGGGDINQNIQSVVVPGQASHRIN